MGICSSCGSELNDGARFCTNCGTPIALDEGLNRTGQAQDMPQPAQTAFVQSIPSPQPQYQHASPQNQQNPPQYQQPVSQYAQASPNVMQAPVAVSA